MANSNYTIIKGFTEKSMKFARSCFAKGMNASETRSKMRGRGYGKLPSVAAVAWAYIFYKRENGLYKSKTRSNSTRKASTRKTSTIRKSSTRRSSTRKRSISR